MNQPLSSLVSSIARSSPFASCLRLDRLLRPKTISSVLGLRAPPLKVARASSGMAQNDIKIYYGDHPFWRAECVRLCLYRAGIPFEDVRSISKPDLEQQGKLTFGATPVMEVNGKILSQTQAMASYCSRLTGQHPTDPWLAAKVDEALNGCTDCTTDIGKTFSMAEEAKLAARQEMIGPGGRLSMHLAGLEKLIRANGSNGRVVGHSITVADLAIWRMVGWIDGGVVDGIPRGYVTTTFPGIAALCVAVNADAKVQEWQNKHSKFYHSKL